MGVILEVVNWDDYIVNLNKREFFKRESDICLCKYVEGSFWGLVDSVGCGGGKIIVEYFVELICIRS